ncbi:MAG TPA: hypothetical protein VH595_03420 [Verrucomicrobiae bacterium]|jgi:hypothetical protein|nr:hypothetical protein [Verrucomicrobiae bacterium]
MDSEFLIKIKTLLEGNGITLTEEQLGKLEDSAKKAGKSMEEGVSGHEVRHGIHLTGDALAQLAPQLGEIGRLAPMASAGLAFLAPAAVIEAVSMLNEQLKKTHEQLIENIKASQQMHDMFEDNLRAAVLHANEQLAAYRDTMTHLSEQQDRLSHSLQFNVQQVTANTEAITNLAKAQEALANARIESGVLAGVTSGPEAAHMQDQERRRARATEEQAAHNQAAEEIALKRATAHTAQSESGKADAEAKQALADKPRLESAINDSKGLLDQAKKDMEGLKGALAEAKANPAAKMNLADYSGDDEASQAMYVRIAKAQDDLNFAQRQVTRQEAVIAAQDKHHSDLTIEQAQNDAAIARLTMRAEKMKELADETARAADEQERLESTREHGQSNVDTMNDETARVTRRNALQQRINAGTATPDEQAEYRGATESGVSHAVNDTASRISAIENNIRFEGGHASAQEVREIVLLNDRLLGLLESVHGDTARQGDSIGNLLTRVQNLEARQNHDRSY